MNKPSPYAIYLSHLQRGELAFQFSPHSAKPVFYPRLVCPETGGELEWRVSQGLGTVYSTSVVYPRKGDPYNVALIDCDEGFRLMSRVEQVKPEDVRIGLRVRFIPHVVEGDDPYPVFVPA